MPAPVSSPIADCFAKVGPLDLDEVPDLRRYLAWVPDPRRRCGRWYSLSSLLAVCAAAVCAGAVTIEAVAEWAADAPGEVLALLGVRRHPLGRRRTPSRRCLTAVLARIDADALDRAVCAWLTARSASEVSEPGDALRAVAMDGKTLRGSKNAEGQRVHLLSAVDHDQAITLAQRNVGAKTNETGEFKGLLTWIDLEGAVVTFDALHTVKAQAAWLVGQKRAHYVAIVKRNQKHLYRQLKALPWTAVPTGAKDAGTGHGHSESRSVKVCGIDPAAGGLPFPGAVSAIKLHRRRQVKGRTNSPARPCTRSPPWRPTKRPPAISRDSFADIGGSRIGRTWSATPRSPKTPPDSGPGTRPAPWRASETSPSAPFAWPESPTSPRPPGITPATTPDPCHSSASRHDRHQRLSPTP